MRFVHMRPSGNTHAIQENPAERCLIINASPVQGGKIQRLLQSVSEEVRVSGKEADIIDLHEHTILPCRGCFQCRKGRQCPITDDVAVIRGKMARAGRLVIGAPVYWAHIPGHLKNFLDRMVPYFADFEHAPAPKALRKGKQVRFLLSCGAPSPFHLLTRQVQPAAAELRRIFRTGGYKTGRYLSLHRNSGLERQKNLQQVLVSFLTGEQLHIKRAIHNYWIAR